VKTRSWFLILIMCAISVATVSAQMVARTAPQSASPVVSDPQSERGGPELIGDANNPVLRYPVGHQHAMTGCLGYLYISKDRMKFESKTEPTHSFDLARADLTVAQQWHFLGTTIEEAEFKFRSGGTYHLFHLKKRTVESGNAKFGWSEVLSHQDLVNGAMRFDEVVAGLRAQQHVAAPPVISMIEPADAAVEGKMLTATGGNMRLRGIVSQESGIASVLVNGQPAALRQLTPQTHEFVAENVSVGNGTSAIVVLVMATDKSEAHKTFTVSRQGVRILEPAYFPYETGESTVRVRGVAAGYANVQRVEISGTPAVLTRQNGSDIEFQSDAALNVGDNNLQGYVVDSNGAREPFSLAVKRLPPAGPQPLKEQEIKKALEDGLPSNRIMALVNKYGVDFALTDDVEQRLRRAGADSNLLLAIAKAKK
jgi:hypothetical protein